MPVLIGAVLGVAAGLAAWPVAGRFRRPGQAAPVGDSAPPSRAPALLVVLCMALWGAYAGWRSAALAPTVSAVLLTALLLVLSLVDFRARRLPDPLMLALLAWSLAQALWLGQPTLAAAALGLAVGGGLFLLLALLRRGAMGAGDVKLAAVLGAVLGYPLILPGLLGGILAAGAAAILLLVTRRAGRKDMMAYGPYLALGAWLVWTRAVGLWP